MSVPAENDFYVGLNDVETEGIFEWTDGSPNDYVIWLSGQPDGAGTPIEDCAVIRISTELLSDVPCNLAKCFVCNQAYLLDTVISNGNCGFTVDFVNLDDSALDATIFTKTDVNLANEVPNWWTY